MQSENKEVSQNLVHLAAAFDVHDFGESVFRRTERRVVDEQSEAFAVYLNGRFKNDSFSRWHVVVISTEKFKTEFEQEMRSIMSMGDFVEIPNDHLQTLFYLRTQRASIVKFGLHHNPSPNSFILN